MYLVYPKCLNAEPILITILADDDYPPYSYVERGELKGFYIDLLNDAAKLLAPKYQIKLEGVPWKRALMSIEQGKAFAIVPPYLHIEARPYINPYSVPLADEVVVTYCHKHIALDDILKSSTIHETKLHLGMNAGYILLNEKYYQALNLGNIKIWENKSTEANLMKLLTNKIDCYVNDRLSIKSALSQIKHEIKGIDINSVVEKDEISRKTAHIGYSNSDIYPYKADFINRMNQAILQKQQLNSN